jgi:hypothetical protein
LAISAITGDSWSFMVWVKLIESTPSQAAPGSRVSPGVAVPPGVGCRVARAARGENERERHADRQDSRDGCFMVGLPPGW